MHVSFWLSQQNEPPHWVRSDGLIFPRRRGQRDYAATAPVWDLNSNSIGLT